MNDSHTPTIRSQRLSLVCGLWLLWMRKPSLESAHAVQGIPHIASNAGLPKQVRWGHPLP